MVPFWFVDCTNETKFALADRHGDGDALRVAVERSFARSHERVATRVSRTEIDDEIHADILRAEGNFVIVDRNYGEGCTMAGLLSQMRLIPSDDVTGLDFVSAVGGCGRVTITSAPFPSDLDAAGVCRCGCGFAAQGARG